jgi:hypothetical protein
LVILSGLYLKEARLTSSDIVAVGAEEPLAEHMMVADFFRKNILHILTPPTYSF